jgi:hypothetical protein
VRRSSFFFSYKLISEQTRSMCRKIWNVVKIFRNIHPNTVCSVLHLIFASKQRFSCLLDFSTILACTFCLLNQSVSSSVLKHEALYQQYKT